jgi:hypothetical protein
MTPLELENQIIDELHSIETRKRQLIREIVHACLAGKKADKEMTEMSELSRRKLELTRPIFPSTLILDKKLK